MNQDPGAGLPAFKQHCVFKLHIKSVVAKQRTRERKGPVRVAVPHNHVKYDIILRREQCMCRRGRAHTHAHTLSLTLDPLHALLTYNLTLPATRGRRGRGSRRARSAKWGRVPHASNVPHTHNAHIHARRSPLTPHNEHSSRESTLHRAHRLFASATDPPHRESTPRARERATCGLLGCCRLPRVAHYMMAHFPFPFLLRCEGLALASSSWRTART